MIRLHSEELRSINQGGGKVSRIKIRPESPVTRQVIISPGTKQPRFRSGSNSETFEPKIIFFGRLEEEERRKMAAPCHKSDWNKVLTACSRQTYER